MTKKPPALTPTLKPTSRAELEAKRGGVLATGPSGAVYRIRQVNLQRLGLEGQLPTDLRELALAAVRRSAGNPQAAAASVLGDIDEDTLNQIAEERRNRADRLVLATVIEPKLTLEDLGTGELDDDPVLPPIDYAWLAAVAQGDEIEDGQGRMLWGPEPLHRMEVFQRAHKCDPETCAGCATVVGDFRATLAVHA